MQLSLFLATRSFSGGKKAALATLVDMYVCEIVLFAVATLSLSLSPLVVTSRHVVSSLALLKVLLRC